MQIILAKTAGFCFGVNRAVKLTYELLEQGRPVATLGPLIHNPQVVEDLESKGAITCDSLSLVGSEMCIRDRPVTVWTMCRTATRLSSAATALGRVCMIKSQHAAWRIMTPPARLLQKSIKLLRGPVRRAPCCWWQAMPGNCGPYYGKSGSVCQLGRAGKTAAGTHTTKIYFCGSANHFQCPKLGNLQGIFEKPVYKCQNI